MLNVVLIVNCDVYAILVHVQRGIRSSSAIHVTVSYSALALVLDTGDNYQLSVGSSISLNGSLTGNSSYIIAVNLVTDHSALGQQSRGTSVLLVNGGILSAVPDVVSDYLIVVSALRGGVSILEQVAVLGVIRSGRTVASADNVSNLNIANAVYFVDQSLAIDAPCGRQSAPVVYSLTGQYLNFVEGYSTGSVGVAVLYEYNCIISDCIAASAGDIELLAVVYAGGVAVYKAVVASQILRATALAPEPLALRTGVSS